MCVTTWYFMIQKCDDWCYRAEKCSTGSIRFHFVTMVEKEESIVWIFFFFFGLIWPLECRFYLLAAIFCPQAFSGQVSPADDWCVTALTAKVARTSTFSYFPPGPLLSAPISAFMVSVKLRKTHIFTQVETFSTQADVLSPWGAQSKFPCLSPVLYFYWLYYS